MYRSLTLAVSLLASLPLAAQCNLNWLPGAPSSGPDGSVSTVLTLPNGDVVAGGLFAYADAALVDNIARWDGTTWQPLGSGANGAVRCVARMPNGDLVAGGLFTSVGGVACNRVARWNGSTWSAMGTGFHAPVEALLPLPNGELIAGGSFVTAGAVSVGGVARWNGTSWGALGTGLPSCVCNALARRPNGDIYVGGDFVSSPGVGAMFWNGSVWQSVPGFDPLSLPSVQELAVLTNGDIALSGSFQINGVANSLALWNGATLQPLSQPVGLYMRALLGATNGELLVAGSPQQIQVASLWRWNGTAWSAVAGAPLSIQALAEDASGRFVVGTIASSTAPRPCPVLRLAAGQWQSLGAPVPPRVQAVLTMPDGDVLAGGVFTSLGGVAASRIARWNGTTWAPLGLGVDGPVTALALAPNGDVVVCGSFQNAGGAPASCIARWNGSVWSTLGAGLPAAASTAAVVAAGDVYVSSVGLGLRRFDGVQWSPLQLPSQLTYPQSLRALSNGALAVGGVFQHPSGITGLALYSGGTATLVSGTGAAVTQILERAGGGLSFVSAGLLRQWDGTTVSAFPGASLIGLAQLPNGDLVGAGPVQAVGGGTAASAVVRLTPNGWVPVGLVQGSSAQCIAVSGRGELVVGGVFTNIAGDASFGLAMAQPACPAASTIVGSGCSGAAGPVTLTASNLPWAGGVFRGEASGMTATSLALQLLGLQAAAGPLPGGAPGCSLFVNPVIVDTLLPAGGVAEAAFQVPNQPSLAGLTFRLQVVGIELGPTGIVRLTSTNALQATIGVL